uniref:Large ribosomal subunit protein uL4m n=1 Tax=Globodera pallida TaxID=36090 RepID=A0A183BLW6_GLOPA
MDKRNPFLEIPEAWVTSLDEIEQRNEGIFQLHPDIFRARPRIDLLQQNITWQETYRNLTLTKMLTRAEMPGGGRKPWPQKKQGRHHAGSIRSPHFIRGGFAHGVRGPCTKFFMLPEPTRLHGLRTALTIKHVQDDLVIVDDFETLASPDPQFLQDLADARNWGYSVLFVDLSADKVAINLTEATSQIPSFNVLPLYGLNCYSIVKHHTLVLSKRVVEALERRILEHLHKAGAHNKQYRYMDYKQKILAEGEHEEDAIYPPFV